MTVHPTPVAAGQTTEELVERGRYGYAHSQVTSDNFPARDIAAADGVRHIVLLQLPGEVSAEEALAEAARRGLERPLYEDALHFGIAHPEVQLAGPVVFLHDPWFGFFGRRDVLCLWSNAGRRELGLEGFDGRWSREYRFAFVAPEDGRATAGDARRSSDGR